MPAELPAEENPPAPARDLKRAAQTDPAATAAAHAPLVIDHRQQPRVRDGVLAAGVHAAHALVADLVGYARLRHADQPEIGDLGSRAGVRAVGDGHTEFVAVLEGPADQGPQADTEVAAAELAVDVFGEGVVGRRAVDAPLLRPLAGFDAPALDLVHCFQGEARFSARP